ncbi:MAG TPA: type V CRISPR-associated protein Cas12a/Cpf1 [Spirochaetota bacterium]|nr:type V CRISPR-associated protein Cas12a/Cpf1 [Spirochaetota bacterium]
MKNLSEFTNLYSLSKTLRFELRPVGETAERIEDFKNKALCDVVRRDEKRALEYVKMKKILDDYYRDFISYVLDQKIFTERDIKDAFEVYKKTRQPTQDRDKQKKEFQTVQKKLRDKTAKAFNERLKEKGLDEYSSLINTKGKDDKLKKPLLWHWLKKKYDGKLLSKEEFEDAEKTLKSFDKFTTYFKGLKQNRDNMFSKKDQRTAISYRLINENMIKHFDNCMRLENIKKNHKSLYNEIKESANSLKPDSFMIFLNQTGIDNYNRIIGGDSIDQNKTGVNQKINLYRQKHNIKGKDLPLMAKLYKQILSKTEDKFVIDKFESHKDMLDTIDEYMCNILDSKNIRAISSFIENHITPENMEYIFIKNDTTLTDISQFMFKDWGFIKRAMTKYSENEISGKKEREKWLKSDIFSLKDIQTSIDKYLVDLEEKDFTQTDIGLFFKSFINADGNIFDKINESRKEAEPVIRSGEFNVNNERPDNKTDTDKIKNLLDSIMKLIHFLKPFHLVKKGKPIETDNADSDFYEPFNNSYNDLCLLIPVYNKTRNLLTQKPYSTDKIKINFDKGTLLDGWDVNKETDNLSAILLREGKYYLAVMDKSSNMILTKENTSGFDLKNEDCYLKMNYKLLPNPSKMLPKVFFAEKNIEYFAPGDDIIRIRDKGLYKKEADDIESVHIWIDFCKESIKRHEEWNNYFNFNFRPTKKYSDVSGFYNEVAEQGYALTYTPVSAKYIDDKVSKGELYLFEIYNKDLSIKKKNINGTPNLHTLYWKAIFNEDNLKDVVVKLNGEAEIFFRHASIDANSRVVHKAGTALYSKNPLNKKNSTFEYDIIKDRRFSKDKFFFHCPITLNFKAQGEKRFNERVNRFLENNDDIKFIGIDRGERHLLYYSVIDGRGRIIEQDTFNVLKNSYESNGSIVEKKTDYRDLLDRKEKERDEARKKWSAIENIKELKSGYLSHIIHELAKLMIKHNAVIVLEDLNFGFKKGRFKIEKQVYQKFEKALIEKLNYLVFKNEKPGNAGYVLKAYQLTDEFESFDKLGKQSGFLFYVPAGYTSKIDPATGFVNLFNTYYENIDKSKEFFGKFDSIRYNKDRDYFEFAFDYKKFTDRSGGKTKWTVCSFGNERYYYDARSRSYVCHDITRNLKLLFGHLKYENGENIIEKILEQTEAGFFKSLYFNLKVLFSLRYTGKDDKGNEFDYILSPVGNFFDSRKADENMPLDADANGAYHIALKGMMTVKGIRDGKLPKTEKGMMNKEWFAFVQERNMKN